MMLQIFVTCTKTRKNKIAVGHNFAPIGISLNRGGLQPIYAIAHKSIIYVQPWMVRRDVHMYTFPNAAHSCVNMLLPSMRADTGQIAEMCYWGVIFLSGTHN